MFQNGESARVLGTRELLDVIYESTTRERSRPIQVMVRLDPVELLQLELTRRRDFNSNLAQTVKNALESYMVSRSEVLDLDVISMLQLASRLPQAQQEQLPEWLRQMMEDAGTR